MGAAGAAHRSARGPGEHRADRAADRDQSSAGPQRGRGGAGRRNPPRRRRPLAADHRRCRDPACPRTGTRAACEPDSGRGSRAVGSSPRPGVCYRGSTCPAGSRERPVGRGRRCLRWPPHRPGRWITRAGTESRRCRRRPLAGRVEAFPVDEELRAAALPADLPGAGGNDRRRPTGFGAGHRRRHPSPGRERRPDSGRRSGRLGRLVLPTAEADPARAGPGTGPGVAARTQPAAAVLHGDRRLSGDPAWRRDQRALRDSHLAQRTGRHGQDQGPPIDLRGSAPGSAPTRRAAPTTFPPGLPPRLPAATASTTSSSTPSSSAGSGSAAWPAGPTASPTCARRSTWSLVGPSTCLSLGREPPAATAG